MANQPASSVRRLASVPLVAKRESAWPRQLAASCRSFIASLRSGERLLLYGSAFLLGRVSLFGQIHPFGVAFAGCVNRQASRRDTIASGLLVVLGVLSSDGPLIAAEYAAVLALVLSARGLLGPERGKAGVTATLTSGASVTASVLMGRLLFSLVLRGSFFDTGFVVMEAVFAGLLACLTGPLSPVWERPASGFDREEAIGVSLLVALLAAGLDGLGYRGVSLADTAIRWLALVAAWTGGMGAGAALGVSCGVVGSLLGNVPFYLVPGYALAGVAAALFKNFGRPGAAGGFLIGTLLLAYQIPDQSELTAVLISTGLAIGAFILTPRAFLNDIGERLPASAQAEAAAAAAHDRLQITLSERLDEFAQVFRELAKTFRSTQPGGEQADHPDLAAVMEEIADRACTSCEDSTNCWKEHFHVTYKELLDLLTKAEAQGGATVLDVPDEFRLRCPQVSKVVAAVNHLIELNQINSLWERRVAESKQIVYGQLTGVAEIMQTLARESKVDDESRVDYEQEIFATLRKNRVPVERVGVTQLNGGRFAVELRRRPCGGHEECRRCVSPLLDKTFGQTYSLYSAECGHERGRSVCVLRYLPERAFDLRSCAAKVAKDGSAISGDNHATLDLPGGKVAVVLSDGMGIGAKAALESSATIDVLAQLMKAGFEREFAVRTVNSILLLRSPEESFATVDMFLFDLYSGEGEFVKIGSCPSYIVRGRDVQVITGASVPIGILSSIDVEVTTRYMRPGDLVLMVTDGVSDTANHPGGSDWIVQTLRDCDSDDPAVVAQHLLAQARLSCGGKVEDDMTIVAGKVLRRADYCLPRPLDQSWRNNSAV